MMKRLLYLAAYDISSATRLREALHVLRDFSTGGQKSVFECYLTRSEKKELLARINSVIEPQDDRFFLVSLGNELRCDAMGRGVIPSNPKYFLVA